MLNNLANDGFGLDDWDDKATEILEPDNLEKPMPEVVAVETAQIAEMAVISDKAEAEKIDERKSTKTQPDTVPA